MGTVYEDLIRSVEMGIKFKIDFHKQNMKVGNHYLIKDGEWDLNQDLILYAENVPERLRNSWCLDVIEQLYGNYLVSTPSERSESSRHYFYAKNQLGLTDEELVHGENRELARAKLEGFILCSVLSGWLTWNEVEMGKWFWQSKLYKELVILREWIEN